MFTLSAVIIAPKKSKKEIAKLVESEEFYNLRATVIDFLTKHDIDSMGFEFKDKDNIQETCMYDSYGRRVI